MLTYLSQNVVVHHISGQFVHLWPGVCNIEVVQCNILDDLLLLVDVAFRKWDVLLCLKVELCRKGVTAALSLWRHHDNQIYYLRKSHFTAGTKQEE